MAQPKTIKADFLYLHLDTTVPQHSGRLNQCEAQHKRIAPDNDLGIVLNNDQTEAIIKVPNGTQDWKSSRVWTTDKNQNGVIDVVSVDELPRLKDLIRTDPNWSNLTEDVLK